MCLDRLVPWDRNTLQQPGLLPRGLPGVGGDGRGFACDVAVLRSVGAWSLGLKAERGTKYREVATHAR